VMALKAGADLVLATPGDKAAAMRDAVVKAVADGRLPESRLDEAVGRVLMLQGEDPAAMVCR
jgi:beta-N-acetylhexosaminidase